MLQSADKPGSFRMRPRKTNKRCSFDVTLYCNAAEVEELKRSKRRISTFAVGRVLDCSGITVWGRSSGRDGRYFCRYGGVDGT